MGLCMSCASYMKDAQALAANVTILSGGTCDYYNLTFEASPGLDGELDVDKESESNGDDEEICVDATLLQHLDADELIFDRHRQAAVLCDEHGSCATFGHMVLFYDVPMMMKTYCEHVPNGCVKRLRYVNSPRMMSRMRIPSRTESLVFTPLSARYRSKTEEMVLSAIVRVGF